MSIYRFAWPSESGEFELMVNSLRDGKTEYAQVNHFDVIPPEIVLMTGSDMPDRDVPASVYLDQLHRALDQLGYRADFDAAMSIVSSGVKSWLESGGELLVNSVNFSGLIPVDRRDAVFRLAARL